MRLRVLMIGWAAIALAACQPAPNAELERLSHMPLQGQAWYFGDHQGRMIRTDHYTVYTTVESNLFQHLLVRVLESTHRRMAGLIGERGDARTLTCYVFASRGQWEAYTRARAGSNAPIYLQIASGGYSQEGIFAGYDIGREQTLSVVAHEAWHQYSWYAFKDRLPAWLEEGMATQNEAFEWEGTELVFRPEKNYRRTESLRLAMRNGGMWRLSELLSTHAGQVIGQPQAKVDAYYAELWSFVRFLEESPAYKPKLRTLLANAHAGLLAASLEGTGVTPREIENFTEHWNAVAGPVYLQKYIDADLNGLEQQYLQWVKAYLREH
ncbi:MAG TPA: hypothetical protein VHM90_02985 [Phycisphaerae bacterium]|nr:hypothetical protein [Phycisphaerae bacterium]